MPYEEENYEEVAKDHEGIPLVGDQDIEEEEHRCVDEFKEMKWFALVFICFLTFGGYYIYDFPGSLGLGRTASIAAYFSQHDKEFTSEMNQALYSIYSWPNTVAATFGGLLIDNFIGLRKSLILFVTLDAIGALIFYFGVLSTSYPVMLLGRFVFGLGNESLSVAQQSFVARYFRGKWGMALAFGIVISFSRVGSSFNFLFSPRFAQSVNTPFACLIGVFACLLSVGAAIILILIDLYAEKTQYVAKAQLKNQDASGKGGFKCSDLKALNREFFAIAAICIASYCSIFPFVGVISPFLEVKFNVDRNEASTLASIFQFACAGFSPFTGGVVDKFGRSVYWLISAVGGFTLIHLLFLVTAPPPLFMMIFMGFMYSILAASLWPAIPYVVAPASVGLAYGALNSMQNAGLAIFPLASGAILDAETPGKPPILGLCKNWTADHWNTSMIPEVYPYGSLSDCRNNTDAPLPYLAGFEHDEVLFMCTALAGVIAAIVLGIFSKASDNILLVNNAERAVIFKAKLARWKEEEAAERQGLLDGAEGEEDENTKKDETAGGYGTQSPSEDRLGDAKNARLNADSSRTSSVSMQRHEE